MVRIKMTRIRFGSSKTKSKTVKNHNSKTQGNQHRCPSCGRYM